MKSRICYIGISNRQFGTKQIWVDYREIDRRLRFFNTVIRFMRISLLINKKYDNFSASKQYKKGSRTKRALMNNIDLSQ